MYAIRNRNDPKVYFHDLPNVRATNIDEFRRGEVPRLFARKSYANAALTQWLRGKIVHIRDGDEAFSRRVPVNSRRRVDWEIIEVEVVPKTYLDNMKKCGGYE